MSIPLRLSRFIRLSSTPALPGVREHISLQKTQKEAEQLSKIMRRYIGGVMLSTAIFTYDDCQGALIKAEEEGQLTASQRRKAIRDACWTHHFHRNFTSSWFFPFTLPVHAVAKLIDNFC